MEKQIKELSKYYKRVCVCKNCHKPYGTDFETINGLCPFCSSKLRGWKNGLGELEKEDLL